MEAMLKYAQNQGIRLLLLLLSLSLASCGSKSSSDSSDLGELINSGKGDIKSLEREFEVPPSSEGNPGTITLRMTTEGLLRLKVKQLKIADDAAMQTLQLVVRADAKSTEGKRGEHPRLQLRVAKKQRISVTIANHGEQLAKGVLSTELLRDTTSMDVVFNTPECKGCEDPTGGIKSQIIDAIDWAQDTIDMAVYGFDEPGVIEALCRAAQRGVAMRVVGDVHSEHPDDRTSYYESFLGANGVQSCGATVEFVRNNNIMHHKFILIDYQGEVPTLITGSANITEFGLNKNHNHVLFIRNVRPLMAAYYGEFEQFMRRCRVEGDDKCQECTPGCMLEASEHGPWTIGDSEVQVYFAPLNKNRKANALEVLRGVAKEKKLAAPDPACVGADKDCVCRKSGSQFVCAYCAQTETGWGLVGTAQRRVMMSMYALTDQCFALALGKAAQRGLETLSIWNITEAGSPYTRDDFACAMGVPVYISNWGPVDEKCFGELDPQEWQDDCQGNRLIRNHNKLIVIDDTVFTGSMNISDSALSNNENTLVIKNASLADQFAAYIRSEVRLLTDRGVKPLVKEQCICNDIVDNDGDGKVDAEDEDCDTGTNVPVNQPQTNTDLDATDGTGTTDSDTGTEPDTTDPAEG